MARRHRSQKARRRFCLALLLCALLWASIRVSLGARSSNTLASYAARLEAYGIPLRDVSSCSIQRRGNCLCIRVTTHAGEGRSPVYSICWSLDQPAGR